MQRHLGYKPPSAGEGPPELKAASEAIWKH